MEPVSNLMQTLQINFEPVRPMSYTVLSPHSFYSCLLRGLHFVASVICLMISIYDSLLSIGVLINLTHLRIHDR